MKFAKAGLPLAFVLASIVPEAQAAVAYSNLQANPPFYSSASGSTIFGSLQDPMAMAMTGSIAMSFVPNTTGTISNVTLGITVQPSAGADGNVNVYLAEGPVSVPMTSNFTFTSLQLLGTATTTAAVGTANTLTNVLPPNALPVFSGNTYYLVLEPGDSNTSILWNENTTGATSDYYASSDMGSTFTHGGVFNSDALEVDVVEAIPEPSTWITGAMLAGTVALLGTKRVRRGRAKG